MHPWKSWMQTYCTIGRISRPSPSRMETVKCKPWIRHFNLPNSSVSVPNVHFMVCAPLRNHFWGSIFDLIFWSFDFWSGCKEKARKEESRCGFFAYSWKFPAYSAVFYLQLTMLVSHSCSFLAYRFSFLLTIGVFFAYSGKVCLIRALRDCKQRSLTVSKKAPTWTVTWWGFRARKRIFSPPPARTSPPAPSHTPGPRRITPPSIFN